jgi:cellulose synthase/poly-beta-1,6-N-acetylglucosamine synthase-like glycosyltransferase
MERGFLETLKLFIVDGNYYLIYYSTAISCIYLLLLFISAIGAIGQGNYSRIKKRTFLFRRNILPGVSVIGPAYNEETNIIESVNSLLNLQYPDYEVIVVNDGSKDRTLLRLIEYFRLEKVDLVVQKDIATRPIRGVYRNKSIPKLTVVDKLNGGKADSLNAGINVACKDYFCGIDADSLLHEDSLLKCAGALLDFEVETVAIGGNIFPVNGCVVRQGTLESIGTPRSALANFQFIEYIRAFMAGRIGWARINSLLIISGAFGLFKRRRVFDEQLEIRARDRRRGHGAGRAPRAVYAGAKAPLQDRVFLQRELLDGGAGKAQDPSAAAGPVAPGAYRNILFPQGHDRATALRAHRNGSHAVFPPV